MAIQNIGKEKMEIKDDYRQTIVVLSELLFLIVFSMIFLKYTIYIHQKICLIFFSICLVIFFINSLIYKNFDFSSFVQNASYYFSTQLFFCLANVLGKKYLDLFIENVYLFMFKIGILCLIPILIYDIIIELFFNDTNSVYHGIIPYMILLIKNPSKIYLFFSDLFFGFIWEVSLWLTIYYFTPCHFIILDAMGEFIETIINILTPIHQIEYSTTQKITFFILYPIFIFFILVFNEIILLNFCQLDYYTRYKIILRQKSDGDKYQAYNNNNTNNNISSLYGDSLSQSNTEEENEEGNNNDK